MMSNFFLVPTDLVSHVMYCNIIGLAGSFKKMQSKMSVQVPLWQKLG